jgi:CheY-like chemotaxis protein
MRTLTALVVDDESGVRRLFAATLRRAGMHVLEADTGKAALTLAQTAGPDLVVTDIQMPELDGLELCRRLRTDPAFKELLIVVVSGTAATQQGEALAAAGCDAILGKPCSPALLLATIQRLLVKPS